MGFCRHGDRWIGSSLLFSSQNRKRATWHIGSGHQLAGRAALPTDTGYKARSNLPKMCLFPELQKSQIYWRLGEAARRVRVTHRRKQPHQKLLSLTLNIYSTRHRVAGLV